MEGKSRGGEEGGGGRRALPHPLTHVIFGGEFLPSGEGERVRG